VGLCGFFGLESVKVANAVAAKTPIKARACGMKANELTGDGKQIVQGQEQCFSEFNHNDFLRRTEGCLKAVRRVRGILKAGSVLPFIDGGLRDAKAHGQACCALRAGGNLSSDGWGGTRVFVQGDHHGVAPGWSAGVRQRLSISRRMTSLTMNSGYRFESM